MIRWLPPQPFVIYYTSLEYPLITKDFSIPLMQYSIQSRYCPPVVLRYAFSVHFRIIYSAI